MNGYTILGESVGEGGFDIMSLISGFMGGGNKQAAPPAQNQMQQMQMQQQYQQQMQMQQMQAQQAQAQKSAATAKAVAMGIGGVAITGLLGVVLWKVVGK